MPAQITCEAVLERLYALACPANAAGMARFGIQTSNALGVSMPAVRALARKAGRDNDLAEALWASGVHEARILAGLVAQPARLTEERMERWVADVDSWDVCDQLCINLFRKTPGAHAKAVEWAGRDEEFVKRAGFVLMATLAVHDKAAGDDAFLAFLPLIEREAADGRNFVKKAVNWALRQIGKRNPALREAAIETARRIREQGSKSARWIAADALRELEQTALRP